jgi:hypothetical protein
MPAAKYDIVIEQGASFAREFTLELETVGGGVAYNLTTADIYATARPRLGSTAGEEFVVTKTDAANGVFKISLLPAQTARLTPGNGVYDVELHAVADNGELQVIRLLEGVATVTGEVTTQR